jgi:[ribosomal protein S5]-alanine N-acetyltransferase
MKSIIETNRLVLKSLKLDDFSFIKNLVNTEGWIKFIGDRNIKTNDDAENYIKKIMP